MDELLWTIDETSRRLGGVSPRTVRRMIDRGELPAVRIGRRVMIPVEDVRDWLARQKDGGGPAKRNREGAWHENKTGMGSTGAATRRTGGLRTPTQAAADLAAVLEHPTKRKPRDS